MKKIFTLIICAFITQLSFGQTTINVMDSAIFYDGYAALVNQPTPENVFRLKNSLMTTQIPQAKLDALGSELDINIDLSALCDNYDRIANVNLAFVPKDSIIYTQNSVQRIELGRFITPFMNKNISPTTVPFTFQADHVLEILKSPKLNADYNLWLELEIFGVPYAANTEVAGCSGRNDVFMAKVDFVTNGTWNDNNEEHHLTPILHKFSLRNYNANNTDSITLTRKTASFEVPVDLYDAELILITSNHGAGQNGEEYVRRDHFIYFDGEEVLEYIPGGKSCEPYRQFNTQGNGIYGPTPRTLAQWLSFNNWCPGDTIPIRHIPLDSVAAGTHEFQINVPDAVFFGADGHFPITVYLQGSSKKTVGINDVFQQNSFKLFPNPSTNMIFIDTEFDVETIAVLNTNGQILLSSQENSVSVESVSKGIYFVKVNFSNGKTAIKTFVKN